MILQLRWLRVFPGRRLEEHLAEPTENDIKMLVNQPERLALVRQRLSDMLSEAAIRPEYQA
jgi:hypothetical protein